MPERGPNGSKIRVGQSLEHSIVHRLFGDDAAAVKRARLGQVEVAFTVLLTYTVWFVLSKVEDTDFHGQPYYMYTRRAHSSRHEIIIPSSDGELFG